MNAKELFKGLGSADNSYLIRKGEEKDLLTLTNIVNNQPEGYKELVDKRTSFIIQF